MKGGEGTERKKERRGTKKIVPDRRDMTQASVTGVLKRGKIAQPIDHNAGGLVQEGDAVDLYSMIPNHQLQPEDEKQSGMGQVSDFSPRVNVRAPLDTPRVGQVRDDESRGISTLILGMVVSIERGDHEVVGINANDEDAQELLSLVTATFGDIPMGRLLLIQDRLGLVNFEELVILSSSTVFEAAPNHPYVLDVTSDTKELGLIGLRDSPGLDDLFCVGIYQRAAGDHLQPLDVDVKFVSSTSEGIPSERPIHFGDFGDDESDGSESVAHGVEVIDTPREEEINVLVGEIGGDEILNGVTDDHVDPSYAQEETKEGLEVIYPQPSAPSIAAIVSTSTKSKRTSAKKPKMAYLDVSPDNSIVLWRQFSPGGDLYTTGLNASERVVVTRVGLHVLRMVVPSTKIVGFVGHSPIVWSHGDIVDTYDSDTKSVTVDLPVIGEIVFDVAEIYNPSRPTICSDPKYFATLPPVFTFSCYGFDFTCELVVHPLDFGNYDGTS